jgi:hypothetical protein
MDREPFIQLNFLQHPCRIVSNGQAAVLSERLIDSIFWIFLLAAVCRAWESMPAGGTGVQNAMGCPKDAAEMKSPKGIREPNNVKPIY